METIMKRLPLFTATLALTYLIFALCKKRKNFDEEVYDGNEHEAHSHHVTDVFSKAKKVATSHQSETPQLDL